MTIELNPITSGYSTGLINDNFQAIETYVNDKLLQRDGVETGEINQMEVDLDMNSHFVYNLPEPVLEHQAARLQDIQNAVAGGSANLITFTPYGFVTAENVQQAVQQIVDFEQEAETSGLVLLDSMDALDALTLSEYDEGTVFDVKGTMIEWDGTVLTPRHPIYARSFGAVPDTGVEVTAEVNEALDYSSDNKVRLLFEPGEYIYGGINRPDSNYWFDVDTTAGRAVFKGTTGLSEERMFSFITNALDQTSLTLAQDISVGQDYFDLSDVTGLEVGMIIRLTSTELWPYDNRGSYYRGETHLIHSIDEGLNRVYFTDFTRDNYTTATIQALIAYVPKHFEVRNITADMSEFRGDACFEVDRCIDTVIENVTCIGSNTVGFWLIWHWQPYVKNYTASFIGDGIATGYGIQDRGCVGTLIDGLKSNGCRRAFDAHSTSGNTGSPSRDYRVTNFVIHGGGAYWPETSEESYGIGNHGPAENGEYSNGTIVDCETGINLRGATQSLSNINVYGKCSRVVDLTYGSGADISNVNYAPVGYPNKGDSTLAGLDSTFLPEAFLFTGRASTADADWDFSLPVNLSGCSATGLVLAFVYSASANFLHNINVTGCSAEARSAGAAFYTVRLANGGNLSRSTFSNNNIDTRSRTNAFCNLDYALPDGLGGSYAVKIDGVHVVRIADDNSCKIGRFGLYENSRPIIHFHGDAAGRGMYELRHDSAALTQAGHIAFAALTGTTSPTSLNGTFGTDGDFTVGITSDGELYGENRTGTNRTFRVSLVC